MVLIRLISEIGAAQPSIDQFTVTFISYKIVMLPAFQMQHLLQHLSRHLVKLMELVLSLPCFILLILLFVLLIPLQSVNLIKK